MWVVEPVVFRLDYYSFMKIPTCLATTGSHVIFSYVRTLFNEPVSLVMFPRTVKYKTYLQIRNTNLCVSSSLKIDDLCISS